MAQERSTYSDSYASSNVPQIDTKCLFEAQDKVIETTVDFNKLAYDYAIAVNRSLMELWTKRLTHYMALSHRFADFSTPNHLMSVHADFVEQAVHDYQKGLQRLADVGEEATQEMGKAVKEGERAAASMTERAGRETSRAAKEMQKSASSAADEARQAH
jgi:hypothetical protein